VHFSFFSDRESEPSSHNCLILQPGTHDVGFSLLNAWKSKPSFYNCLKLEPETQTPRFGLAGPEPKFLSKFIFGPEPDTAPYDFFFCTRYTDKKNRLFENLYKSLFPSQNMPGDHLEHALIIPKWSPEYPKIEQKSTTSLPKIDLCW